MGMTHISVIIKQLSEEMARALNRMPENQTPKLLHQYKPTGLRFQGRQTESGNTFNPCNW